MPIVYTTHSGPPGPEPKGIGGKIEGRGGGASPTGEQRWEGQRLGPKEAWESFLALHYGISYIIVSYSHSMLMLDHAILHEIIPGQPRSAQTATCEAAQAPGAAGVHR